MQFIQPFPLHLNVISLLGLTLLLGLVSGALVRRTMVLPKISGYIAVGFLIGPSMLNMVTPSLLSNARIFIDISLGLILFELGRHLDFTWLRHDRGIILMSLAESSLTFTFIFAFLMLLHLPWLQAALAATIAVATSPAVVMTVANDLASTGPVTRRTLILTSLNNFFGLLLFTCLLPMTQTGSHIQTIQRIIYRLSGSVCLGIVIFLLTLGIAHFIGKRKDNQFVLFVGCVIFAIGFSLTLHVSSMLTLFTLGVAARNLNYKNLLTEVDLQWLAKLFLILLFVITGVHLKLHGFFQAILFVLAFILIRAIAKSTGIWLFAKHSRLTSQQAWALCLSLTPMAGLAVGMSNIVLDFNPTLGYELMTIITIVIAILNIIGPIATQIAFVRANETPASIRLQEQMNE